MRFNPVTGAEGRFGAVFRPVPSHVPLRAGRFGGRLKTGKTVSDDPFGRFI
ncbi:dihydrodipicolinate reductase [Neisseria macacae ATCC 33926]|uniref:Dihydrodipicolinate reductase n=1 Tax=Neisseria macacae ATCC 33926 TaxID=997348 RepID=A0AA36XKL9_9NEIS|nr:dihydrodipicolinate reductase [Neisseria macacae ATCC 33926]